MTAAWTIYTRVAPDLRDAPATLVCELEPYTYARPEGRSIAPLDPDDDDNWIWIDPPPDPLAGAAWILELRYRITCTSSRENRDAAWAFSTALARRALGAIHDPDEGTFTWYGWDLDAMLAHTQDLIDAHRLGELFGHLARAREARTATTGPLGALAERTIAYLDDLPESTGKNSLLVFLEGVPALPADARQLLEDAILAAPPYGKQGKPLRELQARLHRTRDHAWVDEQPVPSTPGEISALWSRALESAREAHVLARVFDQHPTASTDAIILQARAGAAVPTWPGWGDHISKLSFAHTHEFEGLHRDYFALCGPLATWLVEHWRAAEVTPEEDDD